MPPAVIPVNRNRAEVWVVWGIKKLVHGDEPDVLGDGDTTIDPLAKGAGGSTTGGGGSPGKSSGSSLDDRDEARVGRVVYDHTFDLSEPKVQEHLVTACDSLGSRKDLAQKDSGMCVMNDFRDWLAINKQLDFPVPRPSRNPYTGRQTASVHALLAEFLADDSELGAPYQSYVIFEDIPWIKTKTTVRTRSGGSKTVTQTTIDKDALVVCLMIRFFSTERIYEGGFKAMEAAREWDKAIDVLRKVAPLEAAPASIFHTSELWTRAVTEVIAVTGTVTGIALVLISSFLAVWLFTSSARAAAICTGVLVCVLVVVTGLFQLFGWTLGIVEAVGISILLGAAVDYPAHVIERYIESDSADHTQVVPSPTSRRRIVVDGDGDGGRDGGGSARSIRGDHSDFGDDERLWSHDEATRAQARHGARNGAFLSRRSRIVYSMTSVGVSVLNASATTVMSCFILVFCTVQVRTNPSRSWC